MKLSPLSCGEPSKPLADPGTDVVQRPSYAIIARGGRDQDPLNPITAMRAGPEGKQLPGMNR